MHISPNDRKRQAMLQVWSPLHGADHSILASTRRPDLRPGLGNRTLRRLYDLKRFFPKRRAVRQHGIAHRGCAPILLWSLRVSIGPHVVLNLEFWIMIAFVTSSVPHHTCRGTLALNVHKSDTPFPFRTETTWILSPCLHITRRLGGVPCVLLFCRQ